MPVLIHNDHKFVNHNQLMPILDTWYWFVIMQDDDSMTQQPSRLVLDLSALRTMFCSTVLRLEGSERCQINREKNNQQHLRSKIWSTRTTKIATAATAFTIIKNWARHNILPPQSSTWSIPLLQDRSAASPPISLRLLREICGFFALQIAVR